MRNRIELEDTIELMCSKSYRMRFVAEYWQTKIRYEKLKNFCDRIEAFYKKRPDSPYPIEPAHDCQLSVLREQQAHMGAYLHDLEIRAIMEDIDINSFVGSEFVEKEIKHDGYYGEETGIPAEPVGDVLNENK